MSHTLPFAALRVLDLSQLAAGPLVTQVLSDFGAEVLKIESEAYILTGAGSRTARPPGTTSLNIGYFFNKFATNAWSVTLDLNQREAISLFRRLIAVSDVMLDNLRPSATAKWGLTYPELRKVNPGLIMVQMPTMGDGPKSFYGGVSWGIQAMAGLNLISGYPDLPPVSPSPWSHPDTSCNPFHGMVALLSALYHRALTGEGQYIEVSQYESTINYMGTSVLEFTANGVSPGRHGNREPGIAPQGVYRCEGEDRWVALSVTSEREWDALKQLLPPLRGKDRFDTLLARQQHADELDALIEAWTSERRAEDVMALCQQNGIPAAAVSDPSDLLHRDPQLNARGHWLPVEHPELGEFLTEAWGFALSDTPMRARSRAPLLAEHNDHVFREVLGLPEDEVNRLVVEGIIR